jgi:hypothetical protein
MEALLVFGGYFDGLTYPEGFFVVRCIADGTPLAYTLSSFGYPLASRPPEYHAKLEEFTKRVRENGTSGRLGSKHPGQAACRGTSQQEVVPVRDRKYE